MLQDLKAFLMRGNVLDLAVGIIIGAAFGKIVGSFVGDILTPVLSLGLGKVDFSNMFIALNGQAYPTLAAAKAAGVATLNYGLFLNSIIDFIIVGFAIYWVVRLANRFKPAVASTTKECPFCKTAIPLAATRCPACTSQL